MGGAGLLLGLLSWLIQCFASSLGRLRLVGAWAPVFNTALLLAGRLVVRGNDAAQGSGDSTYGEVLFDRGGVALAT